MLYKIINKTKNETLASKAKKADTFFKRFLGLMFRNSLDKDGALIFYRAPSLHTFFMRFAIDIVFLNKEMKVIKIVKELKPFRVASCWSSFISIEFSSRNNNLYNTEEGDLLKIENVVK